MLMATQSPQFDDARAASLAASVVQAEGLVQRRAIAKAITLLESTRADHRVQADALLTALLPHSGKSLRLGISGVPGVGKSTFIEALGLYLIGKGHRVAVLAVDPSSSVSGGSILGDKTRMEQLSVQERAYIRPSPSSGTLGGVVFEGGEAKGFSVVLGQRRMLPDFENAIVGMRMNAAGIGGRDGWFPRHGTGPKGLERKG